ncbi:MAG TPA: glutathione S-transferase [Stellaceae bacterium]|nr:glutathione S-transferase [Stellaceae bacterium]
MYKLFARPGWGSVLAEAQLAWYGLPHEIEDLGDLFKSAAARERLAPVNPLAQVPTLVLPGGQVMTESAAITLHLADAARKSDLVPPPGDAARPAFLRWLVFLVANVYPTFTYADDPARFVEGAAAQRDFAAKVGAYRERLWRQVEEAAGRPWFLGPRLSALDIYIGAMTRWRPRRQWFAAECPRLSAIALGADAEPRLAAVWRRNFGAE